VGSVNLKVGLLSLGKGRSKRREITRIFFSRFLIEKKKRRNAPSHSERGGVASFWPNGRKEVPFLVRMRVYERQGGSATKKKKSLFKKMLCPGEGEGVHQEKGNRSPQKRAVADSGRPPSISNHFKSRTAEKERKAVIEKDEDRRKKKKCLKRDMYSYVSAKKINNSRRKGVIQSKPCGGELSPKGELREKREKLSPLDTFPHSSRMEEYHSHSGKNLLTGKGKKKETFSSVKKSTRRAGKSCTKGRKLHPAIGICRWY